MSKAEDKAIERCMTRFRSRFDRGPRPQGKTFETDKDGNPVSRTKQSFAADCDINNIMRRFQNTGQLPQLIKENPSYGDFSDPIDYQEALNLVIHAQMQFEALPAATRERFLNDPQKFLEFTSDASNAEEMVKLGLMDKEAVKRVTSERAAKAEAEKNAAAAAAAAAPRQKGKKDSDE